MVFPSTFRIRRPSIHAVDRCAHPPSLLAVGWAQDLWMLVGLLLFLGRGAWAQGLSEGFESGFNGWAPSSGCWQVGHPTAGPAARTAG